MIDVREKSGQKVLRSGNWNSAAQAILEDAVKCAVIVAGIDLRKRMVGQD